MREFEYIFDSGFLRGIRSSIRQKLREQTLTEAYNYTLGRHGLEPYREAVFPSEWNYIGIDFPYPRIFNGPNYSYMIERSGGYLHLYNIDHNDLSLTEAGTSDDDYQPPLGDIIDVGIFPSFADFGDYAIARIGDKMVTIDNYSGQFIVTLSSGNSILPLVKTCCNFRGQFIGGNIETSWYGCGKSSVVFSEIGSINMIPGESNIAGNIFIPTPHEILKVMPIMSGVVVYTTGDVWLLTPVTVPAPTFSLTKLGNIGILQNYSVDGDDTAHLLVDNTGTIWMLDSSNTLTELGYDEYFCGCNASVIFDHKYRQWRLTGDIGNYIFSHGGLTSCFQYISGIYTGKGSYYTIGSETNKHEARLITDSTDFGIRGVKTITGIELDHSCISHIKLGAYYRFDESENWQYTGLINANSYGAIAKPIAGHEFRFVIVLDSYIHANISSLTVRYKMSDLRTLRGVYSPPPRGQYAS